MDDLPDALQTDFQFDPQFNDPFEYDLALVGDRVVGGMVLFGLQFSIGVDEHSIELVYTYVVMAEVIIQSGKQ